MGRDGVSFSSSPACLHIGITLGVSKTTHNSCSTSRGCAFIGLQSHLDIGNFKRSLGDLGTTDIVGEEPRLRRCTALTCVPVPTFSSCVTLTKP